MVRCESKNNNVLVLYLIHFLILNYGDGDDCVDFFIFKIYSEPGSKKLFNFFLQIASAKFRSAKGAFHQPAF